MTASLWVAAYISVKGNQRERIPCGILEAMDERHSLALSRTSTTGNGHVCSKSLCLIHHRDSQGVCVCGVHTHLGLAEWC